MKIFSEMIVLHEDVVMPSEESFMPSFWASDSFDSDGDYYYDNIDGRWTTLHLARRLRDDQVSVLEVGTFREQRKYDPAIQEVADLERYIGYWKAGRYARTAPHIQTPAVTSLTIETHLVADYREFLEAVASFLAHTKGIVANFREIDAAKFIAEFLAPTEPSSGPT
jgi:hypothetical protein